MDVAWLSFGEMLAARTRVKLCSGRFEEALKQFECWILNGVGCIL